jgi:outer membrane protease
LLPGSDLEALLKEVSNFNGMSKIQQMDWMQTTNVLIAQALKWLSEGAVSTFATGKEITFTNGDGKSVKGVVNEKGEVVADG